MMDLPTMQNDTAVKLMAIYLGAALTALERIARESTELTVQQTALAALGASPFYAGEYQAYAREVFAEAARKAGIPSNVDELSATVLKNTLLPPKVPE